MSDRSETTAGDTPADDLGNAISELASVHEAAKDQLGRLPKIERRDLRRSQRYLEKRVARLRRFPLPLEDRRNALAGELNDANAAALRAARSRRRRLASLLLWRQMSWLFGTYWRQMLMAVSLIFILALGVTFRAEILTMIDRFKVVLTEAAAAARGRSGTGKDVEGADAPSVGAPGAGSGTGQDASSTDATTDGTGN